MIYQYTHAEKSYKPIIAILLLIGFLVIIVEYYTWDISSRYVRNKAFVFVALDIFLCIFIYLQVLYFRRYSLVTDDDGIQMNYYFKTIKWQWSEVVSVKRVLYPFFYKLITKKGTLNFNAFGLLPVSLDIEKERNAGRNVEAILFLEIAEKAPHVKFINVPNELLVLGKESKTN